MKIKEVVKLLTQENGWYLIRMEGSHRQFKLPRQKARITITCDMHKELPDTQLGLILDHQCSCLKDHYPIVVEKSTNCYLAYAPDLPGCLSVGETEDEARHLVQEAIALHLQGLKEEGLQTTHQLIDDPEFNEVKTAS